MKNNFDEMMDDILNRSSICEDLVDAYELLKKAQKAKSKKQALKLAKEAYKINPACFEAILLQVELLESVVEKEKILAFGVQEEKKRLENLGFFNKKYLGEFGNMPETQSYIAGLNFYAFTLALHGKSIIYAKK